MFQDNNYTYESAISYTIPTVRGKARHRSKIIRNKNFITNADHKAKPHKILTYTDNKTRAHEASIAWLAKEAMKGHEILTIDKAARVCIDIFDRKLIKKPDIDNISKSIFDGMNKIVYEDDKQIISNSVNRYLVPKNIKPYVKVVVFLNVKCILSFDNIIKLHDYYK